MNSGINNLFILVIKTINSEVGTLKMKFDEEKLQIDSLQEIQPLA